MNNPLSLIDISSKGVHLSKKSTTKDTTPDSKTVSDDFVTILFGQIEASSKKVESNDSDLPIETEKNKKLDKSRSSNELLLSEVLNIIDSLKNSSDDKSFPKFSDKLDKILNDKSALLEFKNVKNLDDLKKLSKKYNLGLENIKFTKESTNSLKKEFPKLDLENFFAKKDTLNTNHPKGIEKIYISSKNFTNITQNSNPKKENSSSKNSLESLLKNIEKESSKSANSKNEPNLTGKIQKQSKGIAGENIEKESSEAVKESINTKTNEKKIAIETKNEPVLAGKIQEQNRSDKRDKKIIKNKTVISETIEENSQIKQNLDKIVLDNIKDKKTVKNSIATTLNEHSTTSQKEAGKETKIDTTMHKEQMHNLSSSKTDMPKSLKNTPVQNSLNQFSSDLKETMNNYKSPIMKVQLALNPKNLGEVEVTLIHRGNNLHVNITSNTNTMSLFTQNQMEFKNSLVNMGFTNLEMNFSDQGKNGQQNQKNSKNSNSFEEFTNQEKSDSSVELIVPRYI